MGDVPRSWRPAGVVALREVAWVALATVWAAFITWPLPAHLATRVPQNLGDPLENAWIMGWSAHALRAQPLHLFDGNMFFPHRLTLVFAENMLGVTIPLAPVFWVTENAVLLSNLGALLVTVVAGYAVHLLVRRLTGSALSGVVAAAAFMATPYRVEALSHIHVIAIHVLPILLLHLIGVAREPKPWRLGAIGILVGVQFWSSMTGGVVTLAAIGCWGLWTIAVHRRTAVRAIALAGGGVLVGLLLASPVLLAYHHARADNPEYTHPEVEVLENSTTPGSYLYPPPGGPVVDDAYAAMAKDFGGGASSEEALFPGFVLSVAGLLGLAAALSSARYRKEAALAAALATVGALLSFGPHWGGRPDGFPLPFALVANLVPGGLTRVPARLGALVALCLAVVLGLGLARLRPRVRIAIGTLLLVALVVETWPPRQPFVPVPPIPAAYEVLERREGAVLSLPTLEYTDDGALVVPSVYREAIHLYLSTHDFRPRTNGYGALIPDDYARLAQQVQTFPTDEALLAVRRAGVDTVVVETGLTASSRWAGVEDRLRAWPGIRVVAEEGDTVVFDLTGLPR